MGASILQPSCRLRCMADTASTHALTAQEERVVGATSLHRRKLAHSLVNCSLDTLTTNGIVAVALQRSLSSMQAQALALWLDRSWLRRRSVRPHFDMWPSRPRHLSAQCILMASRQPTRCRHASTMESSSQTNCSTIFPSNSGSSMASGGKRAWCQVATDSPRFSKDHHHRPACPHLCVTAHERRSN